MAANRHVYWPIKAFALGRTADSSSSEMRPWPLPAWRASPETRPDQPTPRCHAHRLSEPRTGSLCVPLSADSTASDQCGCRLRATEQQRDGAPLVHVRHAAKTPVRQSPRPQKLWEPFIAESEQTLYCRAKLKAAACAAALVCRSRRHDRLWQSVSLGIRMWTRSDRTGFRILG
jgi:hypothetical protein